MKQTNITIIIFLLFNTSYIYSQIVITDDCPCNKNKEPYRRYINMPLENLTDGEREYIHSIEQSCAEWLLPHYNEKDRWIDISPDSLFKKKNDMIKLYYDRNTFKYNDSIIDCWLKDVYYLEQRDRDLIKIAHLIYNYKAFTEFDDATITINTFTNPNEYFLNDSGEVFDNPQNKQIAPEGTLGNVYYQCVFKLVK